MEVTIPERTLTQIDYVRITRLLEQQPARAGADAIHEMLSASDLVASRTVPPDVVTMYTQVLLQDPGSDAPPYRLTVCYPEHAEPAAGFVSVFSPVGSSLLGLRVGETARWLLPDGRSRGARILEVLFQPEATGDYQA